MQFLAQSNLWQLERANNHPFPATAAATPSRVLAKFNQIFPLSLIPDDLIIEERRIVWVKRNGIWSDEIISIMATDIACVEASAGPFFGHIHIKSLTGGLEIILDHISRKDAFQIRNFVEALALSARAGRNLEHDDLDLEKNQLLEMGRVKYM